MEIDFLKNLDEYGNYNGPSVIEGDLYLESAYKLQSLGNLVEVMGNVTILSCFNLLDLGSLQKARHVQITLCPALQAMGDLCDILSLSIIRCGNLLCLPPNLTKLSGGKIQDCQNFYSLGNLEIVGQSGLTIRDCPVLTSLGSLKEVGGDLALQHNSSLGDVGVAEFFGYLTIKNCPCLFSLAYLVNVDHLVLHDCPNLWGTPRLQYASILNINNCHALYDMGALRGVSTIRIAHCTSLAYLGGIQGKITLINMSDCPNFIGFSGVTAVAREALFSDCASLSDLDLLEQAGTLSLYNNDLLSGLPQLTHVERLTVSSCASFTDLSKLQSVEEKLELFACDRVTELPSLTSLGRTGRLGIQRLVRLSSLTQINTSSIIALYGPLSDNEAGTLYRSRDSLNYLSPEEVMPISSYLDFTAKLFSAKLTDLPLLCADLKIGSWFRGHIDKILRGSING